MKRLITILFLFIFGVANSATYYIATSANGGSDTNDGSQLNPWLTLSYASSQITQGDSVNIGTGTFDVLEQVNWPDGVDLIGVDSTNTIISSRIAASNHTLFLQNGSIGQRISGIKFDGNNLTAYAAIMIYLRSNVEIDNCAFVDFEYYGVRFLGSSTPVYEVGNSFHHNSVTNCSGYFPAGQRDTGEGKGAIEIQAQDGILIYNNKLTQVSRSVGSNGYLVKGVGGYHKNLKIYNNTITKAPFDSLTWDFAIELWYIKGGCEIYDNTIYGSVDIATAEDEIGAGYSIWVHNNIMGSKNLMDYRGATGVYIEQTVSDIIIEKNYIENVSSAIRFTAFGTAQNIKNIRVSYNIFNNIGVTANGDDNVGYGISWAYADHETLITDLYFLNNVIIGLNTSKSFTAIQLPTAGVVNRFYVRNNIIANFTGSPVNISTPHANSLYHSIDSLFNQNNVFFNNGNNNDLRNAGTGDYSVTVTNYTVENIIKQDPLFVSATDFNLQETSPAINSGMDVGLTTDYNENVLSDTPDIGANELSARVITKIIAGPLGEIYVDSQGRPYVISQ